jgi:hypothetical protein
VLLHRIALSAVVAAVACLCRVAAADPRAEIDRAVAALDDLRYREAVRLLDGAWRGGGNRPGELRRIFALAGTAAGSMGDGAAAQIWFGRWLCLEPSARLPAGSSPKLVVLLEAARREIAGRALDAHATRRDGGFAVVLDDDPLALVVAVRAGDQQQPIAAAAVLSAAAGSIDLVDRSGNVLVELARPAPAGSASQDQASAGGAPAGATHAPATAEILDPRNGARAEAAPGRPWDARWPTWAATAGASAIAGGIALHVASNADARLDELARDSAQHEYTEARAEEHTLARAQWTARVALGAAIASAAVAVVCYVRGREVRAVVTPSPGGAGVAWSIRY